MKILTKDKILSSVKISNQDYSATKVIKRLLKNFIKPYSKKIFLAIFFMIVSAICSANIVKSVQPIIDQIFLTHDKKMLLLMPFMITSMFFIKGVSEYYQNYLVKYIGQCILTDLQMKMYEHLLCADISFIQSQSSARIISRFTNDITMMRGAVSNLLVGCAKYFFTVLFLIIVMFKLEPVISCVTFFVFPLAIYPVQKLGRRIRKISTQSQEELGHYTSRLDETFQSIKIVKSFVGEKIESNRALLIVNNILSFYKKTSKLDALVSPIMETLSGIAIGGIIWYGGSLVMEGKTTPGALFAFLTAFATAYRPFKSLVSLNVNLQEGIAAAKRVFTILDTEPVIKDHANALHVDFTNAKIAFKEVGLNFQSKVAIKLVDLKLTPNKIIAFVGRSGSGKTSLSNLLVRFYDPSEGTILINDHDIKDIKIASLRKQISLVTQDTHLFDTSVAENIAYGKTQLNSESFRQDEFEEELSYRTKVREHRRMPKNSLVSGFPNDAVNATREQIITAAKYADADEFIMRLPDGYDTVIGTQGTTLSGGQRQRLSIARAFLKNSPILIWDEATSSLDQNSEQKIIESLKKLRQGKTTLIITHRLASITDVDYIIVMKAGSICEQGTHEQLLANEGEYYKLYNKELKEGS
ncbi:ABC transporter transmembrane domain-containing protein [Rickettsia endosymbiont of Orchestes rusci]|uniref:ABC transporter transmembrane domain-containing protein n=1 Tax=Rickettsia endosymbiont of Orchestes rusci TaxID=3066250 RepID=UPI00313AEE08